MPEPNASPASAGDPLDAVIAAYVQQVEAGAVPDREALLAEHPGLAERLRAFFADYDRLDRQAAELRLSADPNRTTDAPAAELPRVRYFGDYELLEVIARGGMGVVYKARQVSLNRLVALKMILKGELATERDVARFRAEAEAAANLDHPHVVPIHGVGEHDGQHYYAMRFIEGTSLTRRPRSDARQEAGLVATVARAVYHAHQHGILHRDLKPSNILVDPAGVPYVADFGLAKRVDADRSLTESGALVGTPRYMAPEQAAGRKDLTVAADVYSLGVVLYERLTGQAPFTGEAVLEVLRQVREAEPPRPSSLMPGLDRDLETICLKCLEKDPAKRYASAEALADDLERWLRGEPILARPVGALPRLIKWVRRRPAMAGMWLLVGLVGATGIAGVFWKAHEVTLAEQRVLEEQGKLTEEKTRAQEAAAEERLKLEATRRRHRAADHFRLVSLAQQALALGDWPRAEELLDDSPWDMRGWEWRHLRRTAAEERRRMNQEQLRAQLRELPVENRARVEAEERARDAMLKVENPPAVEPVRGVRLPVEGVTRIALSADGRRVALARYQKGFGQAAQVAGLVAATPQGPLGGLPNLLVPPRELNMTVEVWDAHTGDRVFLCRAHRHPITFLTLSPDGQRLLTICHGPALCDEQRDRCTVDETLTVWDVATGRVAFTGTEVRLWTAGMGTYFRPVGIFDATGCEVFLPGEGSVCTALDVRTGKVRALESPWYGTLGKEVVSRNRGSDRPAWSGDWDLGYFDKRYAPGPIPVALSPDRRFLVIDEPDTDLIPGNKWGVRGGPRDHFSYYKSPGGNIRALAVSPDGKRVAAGHRDGLVTVWDAASGEVLFLLRGHAAAVNDLAFGPDGRRLVTAGADTTVRLWDMQYGLEALVLRGHSASVLKVAFSSDGRTLTALGADGTVKHWDAGLGPVPFVLRGCSEPVLAAGGKFLAARAELDGQVYVWDLATGDPAGPLPLGPTSGSPRYALSPDGKRLAAFWVSDDHKYQPHLANWDVPNGKKLWGREMRAEKIAFSPDGRRLAVLYRKLVEGHPPGLLGEVLRTHQREISRYSTALVEVLDAETGEALCGFSLDTPLTPQSDYDIAFSPVGDLLAVHGRCWTGFPEGDGDDPLVLTGDPGKTYDLTDPNHPSHRLAYGEVRVYHIPSKRQVFHFQGSQGKEYDTSQASDKWEKAMGEALNRLKVGSDHGRNLRLVAFSLDGRCLAAEGGEWSHKRWVRQWDLSTGREVLCEEWTWHDDRNPVKVQVKWLAFSREGNLLAWVADEGLGLRLQDLSRKQQLLYLKDFPSRHWIDGLPHLASYEHGLACSADGRVVVGVRPRQAGVRAQDGKMIDPRQENVVEVWDLTSLPVPSKQQVEALPK
jgi:WD40 repeat protein/tRNA A-37 threonylcarbamoyl transferase component Bud32